MAHCTNSENVILAFNWQLFTLSRALLLTRRFLYIAAQSMKVYYTVNTVCLSLASSNLKRGNKMKNIKTLMLFLVTLFSSSVYADYEIFKDYDLSKSVSSVTTVKVDANMMDVYLEGLGETWVKANNIAKDLGQIKDYHIYMSELPQSGQFNLVLVVNFNSSEDLEPSKVKYKAFMKKWSDEQQKKTKTIIKTYPNVRKLTGEYRMREVLLK